jgi:molybdate transport system ATP-binding protein
VSAAADGLGDPPVIRVEGLSFAYPGSGGPALRDLDLRVGEGELVLVVGSSGSGKSTLLRCLNGLVPHFSGGTFAGRVLVAGRDTRTTQPRDLADVVGLVFQDPEAQSVAEATSDEIAFAMENLELAPAVMRRRLEEVLDLLHLAPLRERQLGTLSGGERQRVAVARALARDPDVLLLDEPLSALDAHTRATVRAELQDVLAELALPTLIVTHDFRDAAALADRMGVIVDGRLRQAGTAAQLVAHPADAFVAAFTGGNLLPGRGDGGAEVALDAGGVVRAAQPAPSGRVGVAVYPWEVAVALHAPADGLNALPGVVHGLSPEGGRVRLRVGEVVVERPADEIGRLGLEPGTPAWATFPPDAVRIVALE